MQSNNRVGDAKTFNNNMIVVPSLPSAGVLGLMNKTAQLQQQPQPQPQQPLKCPRCESSNTKFCYYNNYSLSQPRHFCKACKRYWTRGGTLRNVPVGGGCRKNKRVKRPSATSTTVSSSSSLDVSSNSTTSQSTAIPNPQMNHLSSNGYANPLLYGLSDVSGGNNLPMLSSRFSNLKSFENGFGFNGLSDLGLGFPNIDENMNNSNAATNKTFLSGLYGSLTSSSTPSMAALLATSTFPPHKLINGDDHIPRNSEILGQNRLQSLASLQDFHVGGNYNNDTAIAMNKEGKLDHQISGYIGLLSDPSNFNSNVGGAWLDPTTNVGSSLTSLI